MNAPCMEAAARIGDRGWHMPAINLSAMATSTGDWLSRVVVVGGALMAIDMPGYPPAEISPPIINRTRRLVLWGVQGRPLGWRPRLAGASNAAGGERMNALSLRRKLLLLGAPVVLLGAG